MKQINISTFNRMTVKEVLELAPIELLSDGQPIGYFNKKDDVIVVNDLHPRVQKQFKARERRVRRGMPPTKKVSI